MITLLDPKFRYVKSESTDIRKTFAKVRRRLAVAKRKEKKEPKK